MTGMVRTRTQPRAQQPLGRVDRPREPDARQGHAQCCQVPLEVTQVCIIKSRLEQCSEETDVVDKSQILTRLPKHLRRGHAQHIE